MCRRIALPLLLLAPLLLIPLGCHREYIMVEPLAAEEIVELSRSGKSPEEIIARIENRRTIYVLDAEAILNLHSQGVDTQVIEYMRRTRERLLERQAREGYYYPYPYPYGYYGFWGPYCW